MKQFCIFIVLLCSIVSTQRAFAQEKVFIPTLNKHRFISSRLVTDPFIKSYFHLQMGLGQGAKANLPSIQIGDTSIVPTAGSMVYANLSTQLNIKLHNSICYIFRAGYAGRVGTEPSSLYTNGLNTLAGLHNSWMIRVYENQKQILSTSFGISTYNASFINISKFINDVIAGNPGADLARKSNVLQGFLGAHYAYAFGSLLGLKLMATFKYGDLVETGKSGGQLNLAAALDFNPYPKTNIPVGLCFSYAHSSVPELTLTQYSETSIYNLKLAYTGSDSFIISMDGTLFQTPYLLGNLVEGTDIRTNVFNLNLKVLIYFN